MDRNSELQDIARQLRELSGRLEALIESESVSPSPCGGCEGDAAAFAPSEMAEIDAEAYVEPEPEPEVEAPKSSLPLSVNDRYLFQREIFGGSSAMLNAALAELAQMTTPGEVEDYFAARDFDLESDAVKDFLRLATRRFDSHPPLVV